MDGTIIGIQELAVVAGALSALTLFGAALRRLTYREPRPVRVTSPAASSLTAPSSASASMATSGSA